MRQRDEDEQVYLLAAAFDDEFKADEARLVLRRARAEGLIEIIEMAVAIRGLDGKLVLKQDEDVLAKRRTQGHWLGYGAALVTGVYPLALAGSVAGGLIARLTDKGITTGDMKEIGNALVPGTSALFVLGHPGQRAEIGARLRPLGPKIVHATLDPADVEAISEAVGTANIDPSRPSDPDQWPDR